LETANSVLDRETSARKYGTARGSSRSSRRRAMAKCRRPGL